MEKKLSDEMIFALKILKWSFLVLLILVALFAILFGTSVHKMQSALISQIIQYIDSGELLKIGSIDIKGIIINHQFIFLSFMISACCLVMIIILLSVSLLRAKKRLKYKYNQPTEADGDRQNRHN